MKETRQKQKRRHRSRNRSRGMNVLYRVLSIVVICVVIILAMMVFFKAETIDVRGNSLYTREQILTAAGLQEGDNLFRINKYRAADQIKEQLPYVGEVNIHRDLPDTLVVQIRESRVVGQVSQDGNAWLVDERGVLVDCLAAPDAGSYAVIRGLTLLAPQVGETIALGEAEQAREARAMELLDLLGQRDFIGKLTWLDFTEPLEVSLRYEDRLTVQIPLEGDLAYRLDYIRGVIDELADNERGTLYFSGDHVRFLMEQ